MFSFLKKKLSIKAYVSGEVINLNEVQDEMFSRGLMGEGIAIVPSGKEYYAPVSGTITMIFPTKHALGIKTKEGVELLLHIGIDTVKLKGEGFNLYVKENQEIKTGDLLLEVDNQLIIDKGYLPTGILCIVETKNKKLVYQNNKVVEANTDTLIVLED